MSKCPPRAVDVARAPAPDPGEPDIVAPPTLDEARARLAGYRGIIGRMTREEFDALVELAGPAEDKMAGL